MLTHVCVWENGNWIRVTEEEAAKKFPQRVSSNNKLFMCELCGQFVSFTNGSKRKRYFKHGTGEIDKSCQDRSRIVNGDLLLDLSKNLPVKINLDGNNIGFEIGFTALPEEIFKRNFNEKINIYSADSLIRKFSLERLKLNGITYLDVGDELFSQYRITFSSNESELTKFWPQVTNGYLGRGRLFDKNTGKMLLIDSDVELGKYYYYYTKLNLLNHESPYIRQIVGNKGFNLYEVKATLPDEENARFFLSLKTRLTDMPLKTTILWPPYYQDENLIYINSNSLLISTHGNAEVRNGIDKIKPVAKDENEWAVYNIPIIKRYSIFFIGRTNIQDYYHVVKADTQKKLTNPYVLIKDNTGKLMNDGQYDRLPKNKLINVELQYDGKVVISAAKRFEIINIKADRCTTIKDLEFDTTIEIYIGNDIISKIIFERTKCADKTAQSNQKIILELSKARGKMIKINKAEMISIATIINDEKIKSYIREIVCSGFIREDAYATLKIHANLRRHNYGHCN